ncbi:MAG: UDP-glucose 4-epimerase GalE [Balneolaceae bacterium]|nr:UDP-glucose 4-epimerase GalE [Balneolaceae bacterium]
MTKQESILVTGGAGYIGSHTVLELAQQGYSPIVVDDLSNSAYESIRRVEELTRTTIPFYQRDVADPESLHSMFEDHAIQGVIHFAAFKAVGESVEKPLAYYQNNLGGLFSLLQVMDHHEVTQFVFSSSCTVYGDAEVVPIPETAPVSAVNPYGQTKLMSEVILRDVAQSRSEWSVTNLRYFNPVGAHPSGRIGEDPSGIPNNLMPYITQVAVGARPFLRVFGDGYPTHDGTGVRDYIHVVDLAKGHIAALKYQKGKPGVHTFNLGTGYGSSVLDVVKAFERATGKPIPYEIVEARPGDVAEAFADTSKASSVLNWSAEYGLDEMCRDAWNWQSKNPHGYDEDRPV